MRILQVNLSKLLFFEVSKRSELENVLLLHHEPNWAEKLTFLALINLLNIVSNTWLSIAQIKQGNDSLFAQEYLSLYALL